VNALGAFWPALVRGGKLLARGQVRRFAGKLFNETATIRDVDAAPVRSGPPLFLAGHILRPGGYDHVVFALLKGLLEAGVNVCRDSGAIMRFDSYPGAPQPGEAARIVNEPRLAATPPHLLHRFYPDRRTAAFTMWETDTLPASSVQALNRCGLVIVPSRWGAECFRSNGVTVPIEVVPLGHDPKIFTSPLAGGVGSASPGDANRGAINSPPTRRLASLDVDLPRQGGGEKNVSQRSVAPPTTFGTAGALDDGGLRKNVQRVIDLFRTAFPDESDVRLRVKITPASPPVNTHRDSRIDVVQRSLSSSELAEWYRSLTAYVNGSFGEGFGLHLLEAMACGRPLISTTFGGVGEFFDASVGYEIGYRFIEARNAIYSGRWADPKNEELIGAMQRVHGNRDETDRLGNLAAARAKLVTWEETARKLIDVLANYGFLSKYHDN
jgi:glycosyltransferase involved in cell wall biosynthesis